MKKGYWKIYGRTDDQLMLSTGEKVSSIGIAVKFPLVYDELRYTD
jgi:hypothetical protein